MTTLSSSKLSYKHGKELAPLINKLQVESTSDRYNLSLTVDQTEDRRLISFLKIKHIYD